MLDNVTGQRSQLSVLEISLLAGSVIAAATSPIFGNIGHGEKICAISLDLYSSKLFAQFLIQIFENCLEVLAPASAAFCAAIGIGAEYTGKVAGQ